MRSLDLELLVLRCTVHQNKADDGIGAQSHSAPSQRNIESAICDPAASGRAALDTYRQE